MKIARYPLSVSDTAASIPETAGKICKEALLVLGVVEPNQTPDAVDMTSALNALDIVLQELPLRGYVWPALTAEASLTWTSGNTVTLPADYYSNPSMLLQQQ